MVIGPVTNAAQLLVLEQGGLLKPPNDVVPRRGAIHSSLTADPNG
jgi:hypothetical protein